MLLTISVSPAADADGVDNSAERNSRAERDAVDAEEQRRLDVIRGRLEVIRNQQAQEAIDEQERASRLRERMLRLDMSDGARLARETHQYETLARQEQDREAQQSRWSRRAGTWLVLLGVFWFLPLVVAIARRHHNLLAITALFVSATALAAVGGAMAVGPVLGSAIMFPLSLAVIGWVTSLIWSLFRSARDP